MDNPNNISNDISASATPANPAVAAVALKLPTFWPLQPQVWFAQAEAQFAIRNIESDNTKYHYVVAALDQDTASSVLSLLVNPPAMGKYDALRAALETTYGMSEYERINRIIDMTPLGDEKPSAVMNRMLAMLNNRNPCIFVRCLFLRCLPEDIRATLVHSKEEDCRALSRAADQLWEAKQSSANTISRSDSAGISTNPKESFCWYHQKYGTKATSCKKPCSFKPQSGNGLASRQ